MGGRTMMATMKDPVCGMDVKPEQAAGLSEYNGETYYFCCPDCKFQFDQDPENFVEHPISQLWRS
jgi:YHS domain-containing protein